MKIFIKKNFKDNHSQIDPDTNLGAVSHAPAFEYAPHSDDQPADQLGVQKNSLEINYQPELETANSTQADRAQDIFETTDDKSKQDCTFTQSSPGYDFKDQFLYFLLTKQNIFSVLILLINSLLNILLELSDTQKY